MLLIFIYSALNEWPTIFGASMVGTTTMFAFQGSSIASGGVWAVVGSIVTVLAVQGFKFLGERSKGTSTSTVQLAEIQARREAVLLNVLQTAIDRKTDEKHSAVNLITHAMLMLQAVKTGGLKPEDIELDRFVAKVESGTAPRPVAPIAIPPASV